MKTSGVKVEIFPILGEVTCKARDPFSSSLPGESFSLFCVFFSFSFGPLPLLLLFQEADHHHHQAITSTCFSCLPLLLPLIRAKQKRAAAAAELRQRRTGSFGCTFPATFEANSGGQRKLEA